MSKREMELFIFDIFVAIFKIKETVKNFECADDLKHHYLSWDSVIREFEIIGEASKYLLKSNLIDEKYQKVVDFRNQITHEYFGIDEDIVWLIAFKELDSFVLVIFSLINKIELGLKKELIESFIEDNEYLDFVVRELNVLKEKNCK